MRNVDIFPFIVKWLKIIIYSTAFNFLRSSRTFDCPKFKNIYHWCLTISAILKIANRDIVRLTRFDTYLKLNKGFKADPKNLYDWSRNSVQFSHISVSYLFCSHVKVFILVPENLIIKYNTRYTSSGLFHLEIAIYSSLILIQLTSSMTRYR